MKGSIAVRMVAAASATQLALDPRQPIDGLADAQVPPCRSPARFCQRRAGIDLVLEIFHHADKLARVDGLRRLQQHRLGLLHRARAKVLGGARHGKGMLVADFTSSQGLFRARQPLQLSRDLHMLGRDATTQFALVAQPGDDAKRAIGPITAGLLEAAGRLRARRFQTINRLAEVNDQLALLMPRLPDGSGRQIAKGLVESLHRRLVRAAHVASMRHGYDSCVS